jgi:uncharacterized membrane-anchored protein YhcB (DUF1043 family)
MQIETGIVDIQHTTETSDIDILQKQKEMEIREAFLGVVKEWDNTPELLKKMAQSYELLKPRPPLSKVELINEEREENHLSLRLSQRKKLEVGSDGR